MTPEEKQQLRETYAFMKSLMSSATIPLPVDNAFRDRLSNLSEIISLSGKSATSENQAVDEGGSGTYSVLGTPDEFLKVVINGVNKNIPSYDD